MVAEGLPHGAEAPKPPGTLSHQTYKYVSRDDITKNVKMASAEHSTASPGPF